MKFLLVAIHAKYIHNGLALYSLKSYAGKGLREHVEVAEYTINQQEEDILADIYRRRPDAVGFSCYIWNISIVKRLVRELHKVLPEAPIWLGGPEVSYAVRRGTGDDLSDYEEWEELFRICPEVTGIMAGEGEETFRELLCAYTETEKKFGRERPVYSGEGQKNGGERGFGGTGTAGEEKSGFGKALRGLSLTIAGTVTRDGFFGYRKPLDMDELPFYYEEQDNGKGQDEHRILYYESSRGCPFRCSYCLSSIEKQVRLRSIEKVERELQYFLDRKVKQVKFIDRTFNCISEHALEIWRYLLEHDNGVTNFHFEISAELLGAEELELFACMRPGLIQLEIGVQTTNAETLSAIRRPSDPEKLKMTVMLIYKHRNIHQHLDLIAGLPYEDLKSFRKSFDDVYAMRPDQLQLGFLKLLKGSEMYERAGEYGIASQSEPPYEVLYTKWLSYEDLLELKKVEKMLELYYNSGQFRHTLKVLEKLFEDSYSMFLALAEFYEEKGYFTRSPARSARYEVMSAFCRRAAGVDAEGEQGHCGPGYLKNGGFGDVLEELFRELLTFDYYLREKAKSRPAFARDIRDCYHDISSFYKREEKSPALLQSYVAKGYDARQMMRMTHMDIFCWPVWDEAWMEKIELGKTDSGNIYKKNMNLEKGWFVLFDYEKRNTLTYEACYSVIETSAIAALPSRS